MSDLEDLPVYGRRQRVHCKNRRGPWQEIQIDVHTIAEVDRPQFWDFLQRAVDGFLRVTDRGQQRPEDRMPWKVVSKDDVAALRNGPNGDSPKHA